MPVAARSDVRAGTQPGAVRDARPRGLLAPAFGIGYAVSPDGQRFCSNNIRSDAEPVAITVGTELAVEVSLEVRNEVGRCLTAMGASVGGRRISSMSLRFAARRRRDGRGLPRPRHAARARRRDQGPARQLPRDPDRLARFEREARVLAALNHPHIARNLRTRGADGVHALVLELVEGETLADRSRRGPLPRRRGAQRSRGRSPTRSTRRTRRASFTAISSPPTSRSRLTGSVKVLDFGLAKAAVAGDRRQRRICSHSPTRHDRRHRDGRDPRAPRRT